MNLFIFLACIAMAVLSSPLDDDDLNENMQNLDDFKEKFVESIDAHVVRPSITYTPNHLFDAHGMGTSLIDEFAQLPDIDTFDGFISLPDLDTFNVPAFLDSSSIAFPFGPFLPTLPLANSPPAQQQSGAPHQHHSLDKLNYCCHFKKNNCMLFDDYVDQLKEWVDNRREYFAERPEVVQPLLALEETPIVKNEKNTGIVQGIVAFCSRL